MTSTDVDIFYFTPRHSDLKKIQFMDFDSIDEREDSIPKEQILNRENYTHIARIPRSEFYERERIPDACFVMLNSDDYIHIRFEYCHCHQKDGKTYGIRSLSVNDVVCFMNDNHEYECYRTKFIGFEKLEQPFDRPEQFIQHKNFPFPY